MTETAPTPLREETRRQREVDLYRIVDSLPEVAFDDIARLASMLCDVPIALVTLIDRERQWFKARQGLGLSETPRDVAFCDHAIRTPSQIMEIPDATQDPRFAQNPLVTGDTNIRFYAGMPLVTPGGAAVGTVCVIDNEPRELTDTQRAALESLARIAMNLMEGRRRLQEFERVAMLATPASNAAAATSRSAEFAIAIFEVQGYARLVERLGDRTVERTLQEVDRVLESVLPAGDSVNRVTGSGEFIALLHGVSPDLAMHALRQRFDAVERETGTRVVGAIARAASPAESPSAVYLRADEALSAAKDAVAH